MPATKEEHAHQETLAERNERHFDEHGPKAYQMACIERIQQQQKLFFESTDCHSWLGLHNMRRDRPVKMLDYACGAGMVTECFRPFFDISIGVDVSERMMDGYRSTAKRLGLGEDCMWCIKGDLLSDVDSPALRSTELQHFDLIVIAMALHHVGDPQVALVKLAARLRTGGVLMIVDWAEVHDGPGSAASTQHSHQHHFGCLTTDKGRATMLAKMGSEAARAAPTVSHGAFSEDLIHELYKQAGCIDSSFKLAAVESELPSGKARLFFARAKKV